MPTRIDPRNPLQSLRPFAPREIDRRLDEVAETVGRLARDGVAGVPRPLRPADLLRCLAPYLSRN